MRETELILGILHQISDAGNLVQHRFSIIKSAQDFVLSPEGKEKLDAICLPLSAIGESLKKIDKITDGELLAKYPQIDWKGAKATRDIIVHGYFDIDEEIVFDICQNFLPQLICTVTGMISDIESQKR